MAGRAGRTNKSCVKSEELEERSKEVRSPKKRQGAAKRLRACTMGEPMGAHIPREPGMGTREHGTHRHAAAWSWAAARGASPRPPSLIWKTRLPAALTITKIKVGGKGRGHSSAISGHSKFAVRVSSDCENPTPFAQRCCRSRAHAQPSAPMWRRPDAAGSKCRCRAGVRWSVARLSLCCSDLMLTPRTHRRHHPPHHRRIPTRSTGPHTACRGRLSVWGRIRMQRRKSPHRPRAASKTGAP